MTITNLIIAICVVTFVVQFFTGAGLTNNEGTLIGRAVVERGEWWRVFTAAFLHGGIPHIALNMIALFQVGTIVERAMGPIKYLLVYVCAIVGSGLAVIWFNYDQPTLGASGAIFGLFGTLVAIGLSLPPRGMSIVTQTLPIIAINLAFGFAVPGISNAAHIGGLLTGFTVGWVLFQIPSRYRVRANEFINGPGPVLVPVETIEHPPDAGAHEEPGAPPLEVRDPRE